MTTDLLKEERVKTKVKVKVTVDEVLSFFRKNGVAKGIYFQICESAADAIRTLIPAAANEEEYLKFVELAEAEALESIYYDFEMPIRIQDGTETLVFEPDDFYWFVEMEVTSFTGLPVKLHPEDISF